MPSELGGFISEEVYGSQLLSQHPITDSSCISFIDVNHGREERDGKSWKNIEEINTVVHIVREYYSHKEFCIITQYDAQRAAIQRRLKDQNLHWESVYTVDSFQGQ